MFWWRVALPDAAQPSRRLHETREAYNNTHKSGLSRHNTHHATVIKKREGRCIPRPWKVKAAGSSQICLSWNSLPGLDVAYND